MKKYLFLDFDGVINAIPFAKKWVGPENPDSFDLIHHKNWSVEKLEPNLETHFELDKITTASTNGNTYNIHYSSEVVDTLRDLIESDKLTLVWLTTWREDAQTELNRILRFPSDKTSSLPWQDTTVSIKNPQIGKHFALEEFLNEKEAEGLLPDGFGFVWADDVATLTAQEVLREKDHAGCYAGSVILKYPNLIIRPTMTWGISREDLESIKAFAS